MLEFYRLGREEGGDFEAGIQYALSRLLVDPRFLYRFESDPADVAAGAVYPIGDLELASRLSFFLWSSIPDDELLGLAAAGKLHDPPVLAAQVVRMLADARSQRLIENFAGQWLDLRRLADFPSQDPDFDADLRDAFRRETELLFAAVLRERRSVLELIDADYTYLNERLAAHYGIDGVRGSYMRRVALPPGSPRRGLLGHGSFLTTTSAPNRTSPVVRGQWIVQNLLGAAVPNPPPGAAADLAKEAADAAHCRATRCARGWRCTAGIRPAPACHAIMDPLGLSLENFDLVGRWREQEDGHAIDAAAEMTDGTALAGPSDLRGALLSRSDAFVTALTERLMTYALGRELEYYDRPVVRSIVRTAAAQGDTLEALVQGIVASDPFQKRVKTGGGVDATARPPCRWISSRCEWAPIERTQRGTTMRYLTRKHLSRRTVLRGAGAAIALPLLESMIPAAVRNASAAGVPRSRLACVYIPHGCVMGRWMPSSEGRDFELQPTLQSLEPFRERVNIVSGLKLPAAYVGESSAAANHSRSSQCWLTCMPEDTGPSPTSVDQVAARHVGQETPLPSLELALEAGSSISYLTPHNAAADGDEPARGVRAPARRRQHAGGARRTATAALEPARFRDGRGRFAASAICPAPTASAWTAISTTCASSSAGSRSRPIPRSARSTCRTSRTAFRPTSRSTRC